MMNNTNTKYIIAAVVVIIAVWAGFSWGKKSAVAPESPVNGGTEIATTTGATSTTQTTPVKTTTQAPTTKTTTTAPAVMKNGVYIVSYTNRGFSPATLTIKKGKSVRFMNNSDKAMSLTSTQPESQIYGEFNQGKTVGRGGYYDFTFLTAGSWGYVNRNNRGDTGMVIVE